MVGGGRRDRACRKPPGDRTSRPAHVDHGPAPCPVQARRLRCTFEARSHDDGSSPLRGAAHHHGTARRNAAQLLLGQPEGPQDVQTARKEESHEHVHHPGRHQIFYKDWGTGQPVVFSHGWPLNADAWDDADAVPRPRNGFRAIAHDRRGHGRSGQPWNGNDLDTYADDLAELIEALDLHDVVLVGHSTGGGEVTRYIGSPRHDAGRQGGAARRHPAADAEDGRQPGGPAARRLRRHPGRRRAPTGPSSTRT